MGVNINIASNLAGHMAAIKDLNEQVFFKSIQYSINKALVAGRTEAAQGLRERLNIKSGNVKSKIGIGKAKNGTLAQLEGYLSFDDSPQPLLDFVKGNKEVIKQAGIKVKKRRVLRVEISKGKSFKMKGGFIQQVRSKQVFRRGKSGGFKKQSAPSIAHFVDDRKIRIRVVTRLHEVFKNNLMNQYEFRIQRLAEKAGRNWNQKA
jgi:hypothetical protein